MSDDLATESSNHQPLYQHGVPNINRLNFFPVNMIGLGPTDATDVVEVIAGMLNRPIEFVDDRGFERSIIAGAFDAEHKRFAWVESKSKKLPGYVDVEFRLNALVDDRLVIDWAVQTYNPYFGCHVGYMRWHDQRLVLIYREKHHTYACSFLLDGRLTRKQITDEWVVTEGQIGFVSEQIDLVERLSLPDLSPMQAIGGEEARSKGVLPPSFDHAQESRKRRASRMAAQTKLGRPVPPWLTPLVVIVIVVFVLWRVIRWLGI
jgi:hypothetical protein